MLLLVTITIAVTALLAWPRAPRPFARGEAGTAALSLVNSLAAVGLLLLLAGLGALAAGALHHHHGELGPAWDRLLLAVGLLVLGLLSCGPFVCGAARADDLALVRRTEQLRLCGQLRTLLEQAEATAPANQPLGRYRAANRVMVLREVLDTLQAPPPEGG